MKKILLVPDSFKGTLSSREICGIMTEQVHRVWPEAQVRAIPVADGGEGSVDTFLSALGGESVYLETTTNRQPGIFRAADSNDRFLYFAVPISM